MKKFLLLRSNKQSGPYSAEELQQMGLKAYDLIWVEGKSAAWRYPGEIEELKAFAPAVEEQPYDRFYKKSSEATSAPVETPPVAQPQSQSQIQQQPQIQQPQVQQQPPTQQQPVEKPARKEKEYKRVFVTLPSNATPKPQVSKPAAETSGHVQYQPPVQQPVTETKKPEVKQQPIIADDVSEKELYERKVAAAKAATAKSGFARPAVGESENEIYYPKKRSRFKGVPLAAMIIGMLVMVAVGIVIGMSLDGNKGFSLIRRVDPVTPANNQATVPKEPQSRQNNPLVNQTAALVVQDSIETTETKKPVQTATVHKKNNPAADTNQQDMTADIPVKEEPKITQDEAPEKKELPKPATPNLEKLVSVSNNNFEVGPFGGISKLALTVTNSSEYALNLVVVQLEYLKANKEVYKTENLYFRDVAANSSLTVDAPRSNRGNKINYKITLINSKDHLYHAGN